MTLPLHLDPSLPLDLDSVSRETIARLRKNGRAHMSRARKINLARAAINEGLPEDLRQPLIVIEDFDPIELYVFHNWTCPACFKRVDITKKGRDPNSCVLGHIINLAHSGGHTWKNCAPMHYSCNAAAAAAIEIPREAKVKRLRASHRGINADGSKVSEKEKTLKGGSKFETSARSKWPIGRKIQSRNNLRKRS